MKEVLQNRLEKLGITQYELTRRIVEIRNKSGDDTTIRKLQSSVSNALKEPEGRRYSAISELVEAMDGEIVIRWNNPEEVKID